MVLSVCLMLSAVFISTGGVSLAYAQTETRGHTYIESVVAPTCTEQGYTEYVCYHCGDSHKDNYTNELGHSFISVTIEPTCTAGGYTTHFCSVCGFEYTDNHTDALGHNFETTVIAPTCTAVGYTEHNCQTCGFNYKDDYVSALGHNYEIVVLEPTCTEGGYTTFTCRTCGDSYIDHYTPPKGHSYLEVITPPTCVAYGYTEHICADCGDRYVTDYVRPHGHEYEKTVVKPTETEAGYTINLCKHCGYSYLSDFVTSGDIGFEEHHHGYSLFVARYDAQAYFLLQYYCECGEVDNSLLNVLFIDGRGTYIPMTVNGNGELRYSHLSGTYNVYILNKQAEILSEFTISVNLTEEHIHRYSLTVTRHDEEKYLVLRYACDCGVVDNSKVYAVFIDENGGYITLNADGNGKVDCSALVGDYNVFILNDNGEILSNFKLTVEPEPEAHVCNFALTVTRFDSEKYFTVIYLCGCGETESLSYRAVFIDGDGNHITLDADENGKVNYSGLVGNFNVFVINNQGEMLSNFKLTAVEEHTHGFSLSVTRYDEKKYFTVNYLCECGETENAAFHIVFIDGDRNSITLYADGNGKVDYSALVGDYNVFILNSFGEMLSGFKLTVAEEVIHTHEYALSLARNDNEKHFTVNYLCECGETENAVFYVMFIDENGDYLSLYGNGNGKVDYSRLLGNYNVFILGNHGETLFNFKLTITEEKAHTHEYSLSVTRYDSEKYLTVKYLCECGEVEYGVFYVTFIDGNGVSTTITAYGNGEVRYSQLVGNYDVFILDGQGKILYNFKLSVAADHTHEYTLYVTRHDGEKYFVLEYLCGCGESETLALHAIFMNENGDCVTLYADENGKVDYSALVGKYNIFIINNQGQMLYHFVLTIAADEVHYHNYLLSVTRYDNKKYFVLENLCECGESEYAIFHVMFVDGNGDYIPLAVNERGEVYYTQFVGNYSVFIFNHHGEMLTNFKLSAVEAHIHSYTLSVIRRDDEKYFVAEYLCECGETENGTFRATFIDGNGVSTTIAATANGKVDYSELVGNYNVFILSDSGEMLSNFKLSVAENTHSYTLSVTRYDNEKYFVLKYRCECGETENAVFHAVFIDGNGNSITINANENGAVRYSQLTGNYGVFIIGGQGEILYNFNLSVGGSVIPPEHTHAYTLTVTRYDDKMYFVVEYLCSCGDSDNSLLQVLFYDENGYSIALDIAENGAVDYSHLEGAFTAKILNGNGAALSEFEVSAENNGDPDPPIVEDDPKKSPLPTILLCILVLIAAGGVTAYILKKRKNKKTN